MTVILTTRSPRLFVSALLTFIVLTPGFTAHAKSNTIVVTSNADTVDANDGVVTLREAMTIAHTGGITENGEEIDKNEKVIIDLSKIEGAIRLKSRLPRIDKDLEIFGASSPNLTIDGNDKHRIFFVYKEKLSLSNLYLKNGLAKGGIGGSNKWPGGGGGGMGGAIFVNKYAQVSCKNLHFISNEAKGGNAGSSYRYLSADTYKQGAGGGFFGNADMINGGSGGYLGDEGKGGSVSDHKEGAYGGFGGGGGLYKEIIKIPSSNYSITQWNGGRGGFGGGGGSGRYNPGRAGEFGGIATFNYDLEICSAGGGAGLGGAVFIREYGEFEASNCLFKYNEAYGGTGSTTTRLSEFSNRGQGKGAAIFVQNTKASVCLDNCSFSGNEAQDADGDFIPTFTHQDNNDIYGAYSPIIPHINFVRIEHYPPLNNTDITYLVQFDAEVVGVDITNFVIETDDPNNTHVASVEEINSQNYRIFVKHSINRGFVTLKIIDDDTIRDTVRDNPIGYIGEGNGNFTGETCYIHPTVQIGSILPLTGGLKDYGVKILNGIEMAIAERQVSNTSVTQAFITLSSHDNQSEPATAEALVADACNNEGVLALFGGAASNNTRRMAELCENNQIPLFSPTATSIQLLEKDYTVQAVPSDNYQLEAIYQSLKKHNSSFVIVAEDSEYGKGFLALEEKDGLICHGHYSFPAHALEVDEAITFLTEVCENNSVNAFVMALYDNDANALLKAIDQSNNWLLKTPDLIFTDAAVTSKTIDLDRRYRFDQSFLGLTPIIPHTTAARDFANQYQTAYGSSPEWFPYYAYDAVSALNEAIKNSTVITRQGIWNAIPWLRFEGLTGTKTFNEKGNLYSAAYDLHCIVDREWKRFETVLVQKPENNPAQGLGKAVSRSQQPTNGASSDFIYTLTAADPLISHLAGEETETGWTAQSLDADLGGVLMAYYEDVERGLSNKGEVFVFEDGVTYYLTFNLMRSDLTSDAPDSADALEVTVKSVYRYQNGDGLTHFARTDIVNQTVNTTDWPSETGKQITISIAYVSAAPNGTEVNNEDNRFHWELKLLNAAQQKMLLTSVEIGTSVPTGIGDYMLY